MCSSLLPVAKCILILLSLLTNSMLWWSYFPSFVCLTLSGFGFSDKPQPGYGFDYTLDGNCFTCIDKGRYEQNVHYAYSFSILLCFAEYVSSFESLINDVTDNKVTLVVQVILSMFLFGWVYKQGIAIRQINYSFDMYSQGYFAPVVVKYASTHQEKINDIILLNPPVRLL